MRFTFMFILISLFTYTSVYSQSSKTIRGKVIDASTGEPVIGTTIAEINDQDRAINGTIADANGNFLLKVTNPENQIRISFIGYQTQFIDIQGRDEFTIRMSAQETELEEVVVTATVRDPLTGLSAEDETSATSKIVFSDMDQVGSVSSADALQGQVSGLDVISASGNPGSGSQLVIRGLSTLGNSFPLIVVDGIPRNISVDEGFDFATADQEDLGNLINVSPQDIKFVKVLKDAAATAVWGSKGANGVLLIETNKGSKGKITYNYNYQSSLDVQPSAIPMLDGDEYITLQLEELHNANSNFSLPDELAYNPYYVNFHNYNKNTDWLREITRNGLKNEHYFGVSGGGQNTLFFTSFRYLKNTGTTLNTSFEQFSTRVNLNYTFSDKLRFTINMDYNNNFKEDNKTPGRVNVRNMAYIKAPNMSIWEYDADGNPTGEYFTPIQDYQGRGDFYFNPMAIVNLSQNDLTSNEALTSFKLTYNIAQWMNFNQTISFQYNNNRTQQFLPGSAIGADWLDPVINANSNNLSQSNNFLSRSQLFFDILPNNETHTLSSALLLEINQSSSNWKTMQTNRTASVDIKDPASNAPVNWIQSGSSEGRNIGTLGNVNYKFQDKYLATFNVRVDGNSNLGENNRWTLFPSASFGWKISNEPWLSDLAYLDLAKLRFSFGRSGHLPNVRYARFGLYDTYGQYLTNTAIIQEQIKLKNYSMEISSSWNLGLDLDFFQNRLNVVAEVYEKTTSDLLWPDYEIPFSSGYDELTYYNGGKIQNKGWELFTNWTVIRTSDYDLNVKFNISRNRNMFLEFPDNFIAERSVSIGNGEYPRKAMVGRPIGSFYGFQYQGVWATDEDVVATDANGNILTDLNGDPIPLTYKGTYRFQGGDARYADINHDGNIDIMDVVYLGDSNPRFMGGFGLSARYKSFRVLTFFNYRLGFDIVNEVALTTESMTNKNNQSKAVLHRWRTPGQDEPGLLPRAYLNHPANNLGSDLYVEAGDFVRLNNTSLQYRLPRRFSNLLHVQSANITVNMRKILTFTQYSGQDPEISTISDDPFWIGTDRARTPVPKNYTVSLAIIF
ncbi:MAG: SusC/RagA family TonB-linked outer membrane protein [bacterium]